VSTFDWSKVTAEQLRDVPRAVVVEAMRYATAREVLACIDRIANYLRMCY
jgi:hypothetical protein